MSAWRFAVILAAIVLLATTVRMVFPLADPPWFSSPGVVWHDEGAWVHNARNRALTGNWQVDGDQWNPMYITPVLTGLEFLSFRAFGVGLWQARLVSQAMGVLAVLLLGLGVARIGGRLAGLVAAGLLATNFVAIAYDRAALMEATMVSLIVASWYCYGRAAESPRWGVAAGFAAILAYLTKASAVFFVAALAFGALLSIVRPGDAVSEDQTQLRRLTRGAWLTLVGLAVACLVSLVVFIAPHWQDYQFYNWQVSVTRKPSYTLKAFVDRATWLPIVHDLFTRMWVVTLLAVGSGLGLFFRWRRVAPAERLLVLWEALGVTELVFHDVGNERRLVFLIPGLVALAALGLARDRRLLDPDVARVSVSRAIAAAPIVFGCMYVISGAAIRLWFLPQIHEGIFRSAVRWSAVVAALAGLAVYVTWPRLPGRLSQLRWGATAGILAVAVILSADLWQFSSWAAMRTYKNYDAMLAVAQWLPPGTVVHGKLANGLALESRITPWFVGRGFGNYADRTTRGDIRYLLTYTYPAIGYEGSVITDVLAASPGWKIIREFDVAETPGGRDRAALIDKYPDRK